MCRVLVGCAAQVEQKAVVEGTAALREGARSGDLRVISGVRPESSDACIHKSRSGAGVRAEDCRGRAEVDVTSMAVHVTFSAVVGGEALRKFRTRKQPQRRESVVAPYSSTEERLLRMATTTVEASSAALQPPPVNSNALFLSVFVVLIEMGRRYRSAAVLLRQYTFNLLKLNALLCLPASVFKELNREVLGSVDGGDHPVGCRCFCCLTFSEHGYVAGYVRRL
jgi:hypothetical protein